MRDIESRQPTGNSQHAEGCGHNELKVTINNIMQWSDKYRAKQSPFGKLDYNNGLWFLTERSPMFTSFVLAATKHTRSNMAVM